jgi:hypothetical protein
MPLGARLLPRAYKGRHEGYNARYAPTPAQAVAAAINDLLCYRKLLRKSTEFAGLFTLLAAAYSLGMKVALNFPTFRAGAGKR